MSLVVKTKFRLYFIYLFLITICNSFSQNVSLFKQFSGRFDFTFVGNTLNKVENNSEFGFPDPPCEINTSSSANLNLNSTDIVEKAYLYWAGSGTGDLSVKLNGQNIVPDRNFNLIQPNSNLPFFSAFKDITTQILATGNGTYTLSDFDLTSIISNYCPNATNFGGWAILIVYKNASFPINQLNVYDGLQNIPISTSIPPATPNASLSIVLNSLNVIDNTDAKVGFIAWEGDKNLANQESLTINGNLISNLPLNPADNAFNGTNTVTGSDQLYNMDLDIYPIQNNIAIGDTSAVIKLTSGQDFVMINTIITKLNSQLPDATIVLNSGVQECNSKKLNLNFTVFNTNASAVLPIGTKIVVYANTILVGQFQTNSIIAIGGNENQIVSILLPNGIQAPFSLKLVIDDTGNGTGTVIELIETNNEFVQQILPLTAPKFKLLDPLFSCNQELTKGTFDFLNYNQQVIENTITDTFVGYYESFLDAQNEINPIINTSNYNATSTPKQIYIKIKNAICNTITSFELRTKNCPVTVYNFVSANNDGSNDAFFIKGLRDIFVNFELQIYNRWGQLVWVGNNQKPDWNGEVSKGIKFDSKKAPDSTYFYILYLNDDDYPSPLNGYLYLAGNK